MIEEKQVYVAYCDQCGCSLMYDDAEMCYDTEEDIKREMGFSDWNGLEIKSIAQNTSKNTSNMMRITILM